MPTKKSSLPGGPTVNLRRANETWEQRRAEGKAMRRKTPRESHADYKPAADRPDPVDIVIATNAGRQEHLIPLRMLRMASSPFAFLRGAAAVMARDLAPTPVIDVPVMMDGDAHLSNFGLYGSPQREVLFDLNDFDETMPGHWEWDLKRLAASVNVAARHNLMSRRDRRASVMEAVAGYRTNLQHLEAMGILDIWCLHSYPGRENPLIRFDPQSQAIVRAAVKKAGLNTNNSLLAKIGERGPKGEWRLREEPPILTRIPKHVREQVIDGLDAYAASLTIEHRSMLSRYHVVDVGHRVVGVGSVGTRAYLAMLFGNGEHDPLFLQVKEAIKPAHAPYLPKLPAEFAHEGARVVIGQRSLQSSSDIMLGWTTIDRRPFYVRQMKNMKGAVNVEALPKVPFNFYAWACGSVLARAHARTGDAGAIAGYCGKARVLDKALAAWAESYGEQVIADHAALVKAVKQKRVPVS